MESVEMVAADTTFDHALTPPHSYEPDLKRPKLDKQRPVGIAQPFRQLPLEGVVQTTPTKDVLQPPQLQALKDTPECSDSDESLHGTNRFDRFVNESESKTKESEFVEAVEDEKMSWDGAGSVQSTPHTQTQGSTGVPGGHQWMVFVSHSTSDKAWVREEVILPLRDLHIPVTASYHFMPDASRYDDKAIQRNMSDSCIIIIVLSQPYLKSGRCTVEWGLAVQLHQSSDCRVVVVSAASCSRPHPLRQFLYLDFVDLAKRNRVWDKLMETIELCINPSSGEQQPSLGSTSLHGGHTTASHHHHQHNKQPISTDQHTITHHTITPAQPHTITEHHPSNISTDFPYQPLDEQQRQHLNSGFEQMYQDNLVEKRPPLEGDFPLSDHVTHRDDHVIPSDEHCYQDNVSSVGSHVTEEGDHVIQGSGHVTEEVKDVEEGEVDSSDEGSRPADQDEQASKVTTFYNQLARPDADKRQESPIFFMRNFNNWVKSVLIRSYLDRRGAIVLDLCCGKGGDLLKWKEGRISYLVCADISDVSVEAAKGRYHSPKMMRRTKPFDAEFICADCCQVRLRDRYTNPGRRFNFASCQFSIHYSFESYDKAHMMLRNACENIIPGGHFIGTTVDANQLVYRLREAGRNTEGLWSFGNDIFTVTLDPSLDPTQPLPLFGAKYNFRLHGVVDLPEYLVHFPTFQKMLAEFDMEFVHRQNFVDFFHERRHKAEDADLLFRMSAFDRQTGTMSADEWEAIGLYMVFVFKKHSPSVS